VYGTPWKPDSASIVSRIRTTGLTTAGAPARAPVAGATATKGTPAAVPVIMVCSSPLDRTPPTLPIRRDGGAALPPPPEPRGDLTGKSH
jgi:hypothetical protein